jgi:hypothetical protein
MNGKIYHMTDMRGKIEKDPNPPVGQRTKHHLCCILQNSFHDVDLCLSEPGYIQTKQKRDCP